MILQAVQLGYGLSQHVYGLQNLASSMGSWIPFLVGKKKNLNFEREMFAAEVNSFSILHFFSACEP